MIALYKISGHSMEPILKEGSHVIVNKWAKLKVGDIIVFNYADKIMIKRITHVKNNIYSVSGDNKADSLKVGKIAKDNVIGKVWWIF